ncbi:MAG: hypothetical protein ACRDOL_29095 [Streptosporangiaceae bacterium]
MITVLRETHAAVEEARSRGQPALDPALLKGLRKRYDEAVTFGIIHNRLRDWDGDGNHPGYALGCWLRDYADQVWLFTTEFQVEWTNNSSERAVKGPKRHQAVSGYWHNQQTLTRWCRTRSYLDSAASHGLNALDVIRAALVGTPWLPVPQPALPAVA